MSYTLSEEAKFSTYWNDEKLYFDSQYSQYPLICRIPRRGLRPTDPLRQWVPGVRPYMREAAKPPTCSAEIKNTWCYTSTLQYTFIATTMSNCPPFYDIQKRSYDSERNCDKIVYKTSHFTL
jgi:hypothetical protein